MSARRLLYAAIAAAALLAAPSCGRGPATRADEEAARHNIRGAARMSRQEWSDAEREFRAGLAVRPEDAVLLDNLAVALLQQDRGGEAEAVLRRAEAAAPNDLHVRFNLGLIAKAEGRFEDAAREFALVAAGDPDDVATQYQLGSVLSRTSDAAGAERAFRAALERNPTHVSSLYGLGRLLSSTGRAGEGAELIRRSQAIQARSGIDAAVGSQYGEQGPYALVELHPASAFPPPPAVAVRLVRDPALRPEADARAFGRASEIEVDADHDGDLDLLTCRDDGTPDACGLRIDAGPRGLVPAEPPLPRLPTVPPGAVRVAFSDVDDDRDVDLLIGRPGDLRLLSNLREGRFEDVSEASGLGAMPGAGGPFAVADLDKDGAMDLVVATSDGIVVLRNHRGTFAESERIGAVRSVSDVAALDLDNDGFIDLAAATGTAVVAFRNDGSGAWPEAARADGPYARILGGIDADGDGDLDLDVEGPDGERATLRNDGGEAHRSIAIVLRGRRDNGPGIGSKLTVLSGTLRQKLEVVTALPLRIGVGDRDRLDDVRVLWPGGVLQDEVDLPSGVEPVEIEQLDRKGTSCPLLYAWRDGGYRFVTDFLGGCAIGYLHEPGVYSEPDTDETVAIEDGLDVVDGRARVRLNNQLEEVLWFDAVELVAVDHPEGTEVFPDERLMPGPPYPSFGLFASADVRGIRAARETEDGDDVTDTLRERDRRTVDGFDLLPYKGYAENHALELDLGDLPAGRRVVLLLDGWIDYADSSSNLAAAQAGVALLPPELDAADGRGGWRTLDGVMGFPAGLPKTMAVDLTGRLAPRDGRVRIRTNMRIYWDRARVLVGGENVPLDVRRFRPERAVLRFGGFPTETSPDGRPPFAYDPERVETASPWRTHAGAYTALGDVTERLLRRDDRLVTTRNGDEIELTFRDPGPVAEGRVRTWLLWADGFGKDMDPNSRANDEVGPVPFHGMPTYPYGDDVVPPRAPEPPGARRVVVEGLSGGR